MGFAHLPLAVFLAEAVIDFGHLLFFAVAHPVDPTYVYTTLGVYRVDAKTGAWQWVVEAPQGWAVTAKDGKTATAA